MNCRILSEDIVLDGYLIPKKVKLRNHIWFERYLLFLTFMLNVRAREYELQLQRQLIEFMFYVPRDTK